MIWPNAAARERDEAPPGLISGRALHPRRCPHGTYPREAGRAVSQARHSETRQRRGKHSLIATVDGRNVSPPVGAGDRAQPSALDRQRRAKARASDWDLPQSAEWQASDRGTDSLVRNRTQYACRPCGLALSGSSGPDPTGRLATTAGHWWRQPPLALRGGSPQLAGWQRTPQLAAWRRTGCEEGAPMSRSAVPSDRARLPSVLQRPALARQVVGGGPALAGPGHDRAESQHDWVTNKGSHGHFLVLTCGQWRSPGTRVWLQALLAWCPAWSWAWPRPPRPIAWPRRCSSWWPPSG